MTIHEKKQYLKQYRQCLIAERRLSEELDELRETFLPSVVLDDMPHSHRITDLSDYAAKVDKLLRDLKDTLNRKWEVRAAIREGIERMTDETEKTVLMERYIFCRRWEEIDIGYERRQLFNLHQKALEHFEPRARDPFLEGE